MSTPKDKKKRASKYEEKVKFEGTFEEMINISLEDADKKVKEKNEKPSK